MTRLRAILVAAGAALLVTGAVVVLATRLGADSDPVKVVAGSGQAGPDGVVEVPGLASRRFPAVAWTGDRLFVFGGEHPTSGDWTFLNDGAVVEPATGDAEVLPEPPFDLPLSSPQAITTDDEVVVIGHLCDVPPGSGGEDSSPPCEPGTYAAATYNLTEHVWSSVEIPDQLRGFTTDPPTFAVVRGLGATADGRAVIEMGTYLEKEYWTYHAARDAWTRLPDAGVRSDAACVSDDRLVVLTTKYQHNETIVEIDPGRVLVPGQAVFGSAEDGHVQPSLAILDLGVTDGGSWRLTEPAAGTKYSTGPPQLACMGSFAMAVSQMTPSESPALYDIETDAWSLPAPPPIRRYFNQGPVWTGSELIFTPVEVEFEEPGLAYDPSTNTWRTLTGFPPWTRDALAAGTALAGYSQPISTQVHPPAGVEIPFGQPPEFAHHPPGVFTYVPG